MINRGNKQGNGEVSGVVWKRDHGNLKIFGHTSAWDVWKHG